MITVIQRVRFVLMYQLKPAIIDDERTGSPALGEELQESGATQPAIIEAAGLHLHSATPKTAAEAAKINEAIARIRRALPPIIP